MRRVILCTYMKEERRKIIKSVYEAWRTDRISERAAALAFYSLISLVPLAVFGIALVSLFSSGGAIESYILSFSTNIFGSESAPFFERILEGVDALASNIFFSVVGIVVLLYGASRLFVHLRRSLKEIFAIEASEGKGEIKQAVQERAVSLVYLIFAFMLAIGFIFVNVAIATSIEEIRRILDVGLPSSFFHSLNTLVTLAVVGGLYTLLYRIGSQFKLQWKHAFSGGVVASLLFLILNGAFAYYLQSSLFLSVFGPSIFLIALLLWIYYGLQILFIGAEVADVYQRRTVDMSLIDK